MIVKLERLFNLVDLDRTDITGFYLLQFLNEDFGLVIVLILQNNLTCPPLKNTRFNGYMGFEDKLSFTMIVNDALDFVQLNLFVVDGIMFLINIKKS